MDFIEYIKLFLALFFCYFISSLITNWLSRRNQPTKKMDTSKDEITDNEFHNDFSKVPSATENLEPPRPRDYFGNISKNLDEAFKEDMERIGIDVDKTRAESKKKK